MHSIPVITLSVCQLRPESKGRIQITSPDPRAYPAIHPDYLATPSDQQTAADSLKFTRRLVEPTALKAYVVREHLSSAEIKTDEDLSDRARNTAQTISHPTSTCKMGSDVSP